MFCPHCAAPQIRVLVAEPVPVATLAGPTEVSLGAGDLPAHQTVPVLALPVQWSRALKPCFLAALIASVLMLMQLHPAVAIPSAGFLSVVFYRYGQQNLAVRLAVAVRVGAFGGLLNAGLMVLVTALMATVPDVRSEMREKLVEMAQKAVAANSANPVAEWMLRELKTPDGLVLVVIVSCAAGLVMSLLLGGAGGAIAGAIFKRRNR